jgi:hypothetical protein
MFTPPKRYLVAQTRTSERICICGVEEIAALLNANKIQEDYVAREWTGPLSTQEMNNSDAAWVTVAQLLAAVYKDKPIVTVVLKDVENNTILLSERYHSEDGPWQVALKSAENYFDQHLDEFAQTPPKEFLLYFKSDKCPPSVMTFKLKVESHTVRKGIIDSKYEPSEETFPYQFVDDSTPHNVEAPDEFPSVAIDLKPPGYDPTAPLPPGF